MPPIFPSRRLAIRRLRRQPSTIVVLAFLLLALFTLSTTAFLLPSPPPSIKLLAASPQATPPHHQQRLRPSILPALHRLLQSTASLLLLTFATSLAFPALAFDAPAPQTSTIKPAAAANLPADVIATAVISLGKNANVDRLLLPPSPSSSTTSTSRSDSSSSSQQQQEASPALYVTARVGSRGRVLASIKLPLQSLPSPAFPAFVQIKEKDIYAETIEQQHRIAQEIQLSDLVLSARLDRDGQASTRSPEDLVGQGVMCKFKSVDSAQWSRADVLMTGRGAFGEFVTGGGGGKVK